LYELPDAEWFGIEAIRLPFVPEMYLVPLFGHTRGHCGIAIQDRDSWLFNCGDAVPIGAQFDLTPPWVNRLILGAHVSCIQEWAAAHPEVRLLAGHMWRSFFENEQFAA
jgi:glyoxylase-like metal-dependent hydrolase (beta-lactamase superfamily II)